jgi:hypothetical protein
MRDRTADPVRAKRDRSRGPDQGAMARAAAGGRSRQAGRHGSPRHPGCSARRGRLLTDPGDPRLPSATARQSTTDRGEDIAAPCSRAVGAKASACCASRATMPISHGPATAPRTGDGTAPVARHRRHKQLQRPGPGGRKMPPPISASSTPIMRACAAAARPAVRPDLAFRNQSPLAGQARDTLPKKGSGAAMSSPTGFLAVRLAT